MKKILKFSAPWCQPCKMLTKTLEAANLPVEIEEIDIDENIEKATEFSVRGVPTLVLMEDEKELRRVVGNKTLEEIKAFFDK